MTDIAHPRPALFSLGQIVATPGALAVVDGKLDLLAVLRRHQCGDWGCIDMEDWLENGTALQLGNRIMSVYPIDPALPRGELGENCLWIITEADRSVTTVLLPSEY